MNIFLDDLDYCIFQKMIVNFNTIKPFRSRSRMSRSGRDNLLVEIYCYTLMPNHFHFILKEISEKGISLFFQKILSQYSNYFNKKYNRRGPLFESRFKDKLIDTDQYFDYLVEYIWNNPVKLIRSDYVSKDLLNEKISLSHKEREFAREYQYKYFVSRSGRG